MQGHALTDDDIRHRVTVYNEADKNGREAARRLGIDPKALRDTLKKAAQQGMMLDDPAAWPGFVITRESKTTRVDKEGNESSSQSVTQKLDTQGEDFAVPETHLLGKITYQVSGDGKIERSWPRVTPDEAQREAAMRAVVDALKDDLPRAAPVLPVPPSNEELLSQYTITDLHLGMLAWGEETRSADWDLSIAEKLILAWFAAAIAQSPASAVAVLAQLGDLLHHDAKVSVTPGHGHVLDADSRLQKMIRVAIRIVRQIVRMLLEKHGRVHIIMADANHDEAGGSWLRELFAALYEDEPRVTVETSPSTYVAVEHGLTSLFYHHGHKKKTAEVDRVFAGTFRELFGRTKFSYGHTGHKHSDEMKTTNLMKVEQHETLAPPDAYGSNWLSGRSAKVITYSKRFGEVGRITLTPEMVAA
jgi:hypothetical protein